MEEVEDLLQVWGLPELLPIFKANEINIQALSALSSADVKELIPQVGPRALFVRSWGSWKNDFMSLPSCNVSLSDIQVLALDDLNDTTEAAQLQTSPPKTITYTLIEETNNNITSVEAVVQDPHTTQQQTTRDNIPSINKHVQNDLLKLLSEDFGASSLVNYVGGVLPNDLARNLLATTISKTILKSSKNDPITSAVYNKWCKDIKELYPNERITSYYIPPCVTAQGITHQARGKLISQVFNLRRKYQRLGVLSRREKNIPHHFKEARPYHNLPTAAAAGDIDVVSITEDLLWLNNTSEPWTLVLAKWENTFPKRYEAFKESACTVEQYFELYPSLRKPLGYNLLTKDFETVNAEYNNNLHLNFPHIKTKLKNILSRKHTTTKDPVLREIYELSNGNDEEKTNLAAILSLTELINASVIAKPPPVATTSACNDDAQPAKKRKVKEPKWKPTKAEYREAFISHVKDDSYLTLAITKRYEKIIEKGLSPQPYVVAVGPNLQTIKSYFVVVNPKVFYNLPTILSAIDTCFKIIWSLNLEYSADCYGPWMFIQKGCYKLVSPYDKGSTNVESLLTDCDLL